MTGFILGISAFYHDSAAVLLRDGRISAAAQEERFTCVKHDFSFPAHAVSYVFDEAGILFRPAMKTWICMSVFTTLDRASQRSHT